MPEWLSGVDPAQAVVVVLVMAGVLWVTVKVWPVLRRMVQTVDTLSDLPERLQRIERQVGIVRGEVTHNGGTSLKDAVRRVEQGQAAQDAQLERLDSTFRQHLNQ